MNLVSYEYVACQREKTGVLILSEFAGAAQSLGAGSILVNPWNISDMASAIEEVRLNLNPLELSGHFDAIGHAVSLFNTRVTLCHHWESLNHQGICSRA